MAGSARGQIRLAFAIAFASPTAYLIGCAGGLAMLVLLIWSGGFLVYYPSSGWDFYASTQETGTIVVLGVLFGMLLPLQVAAIAKARSAAGTTGGVLGTVFGVLSMSCCAPLMLPALLSFVGFSGMTLLQVNVTVHQWTTPLTIGSIGFMLLAIYLVSRTDHRSLRAPAACVNELATQEAKACSVRKHDSGRLARSDIEHSFQAVAASCGWSMSGFARVLVVLDRPLRAGAFDSRSITVRGHPSVQPAYLSIGDEEAREMMCAVID